MPNERIWDFVSEPRNLAVLVALGTGVGFLWTGRVDPGIKAEKVGALEIFQHATADGGVAVNATGRARVTLVQGASPTARSTSVGRAAE